MELSLTNQTPLPACLICLVPGASSPWTLIAKGSYRISPSGGGATTVERLAKPLPLVPADVPFPDVDPATTAPRYESDFAPFKPRADCLCVGTAHPPGGASAGCVVSFGVGNHFDKSVLVVGDRQWVSKLGGLRVGTTEPAMFRSMPLTFANAYGGQDMTANDASAFFAPNPSGKGYAVSSKTALGRPLPNLEDPAHPLRSWSDRVEPRAFGPVGRTWQSRLGRAGTFDDHWKHDRAPRPPADFNERYYNAAPDDQQVEGYLRGDEDVRLTNLHPQHSTLTFRLPGVRVRAFAAPATLTGGRYGASSGLREVPVKLDTLWVDADALQVVLVWRGRFEPQPSDARVLVVEERIEAARTPPDGYRHVLEKMDAEAAAAARREEEIDRLDEEEGADAESESE